MLHAVNIEPTPRPCDPAAHAESVACAAFERLLELGRARGERKLGKRQWLKTFARAQAAAAGLYREGITEADWIAATLASLTRSGVARTMKVNHEWTRIQNRFYLYRLLYIRGSLLVDS